MKKYLQVILPSLLAIFLFSHAYSARAAIAFDNAAESSYSNNGTLTWTHVATSSANRILFVGLMENNSSTVSSVTYAGTPMTLIGKKYGSTSNHAVYLYYLINPASGSNTVSASFTNSGSDYLEGDSVSYTGALQTGQPDNFAINDVTVTSSYSNEYTTLTTNADNSWGVEMAGALGVYGPSSLPSTEREGTAFSDGGILDTNGATTPPGSMAINAVPTSAGEELMVMASFAPYVAAPNPPQSLVATHGYTQVSLSWSAPSGGDAPTQYLIDDRFTGSSTFVQVATTSAVQTTDIVPGLTNGQSYDFEILAQNSGGTSSASNIASSTPNPTIPSAPQSLAATSGDRQAFLAWTAPSSNGGSSLSQYLIYDRFTGSSTFVLYATTTPATTTSTINALANGQSYDFEVLAQTSFGTSTPSNIASTTPNYLMAISTTGGGNWSSTSTWQGGVVPGDDYFVTIQGPVVINQNIGSVGGGGIKRITLTGSGAVLSVSTSSPRTILFASTGNNPEGSGSATAPGNDATMFGFWVLQGHLALTGTQADPVTIEAANGTSPIYIIKPWASPYATADITLKWNDIYDLGTSATSTDCSSASCFPGIAWATNSFNSSDFIDVENSRFTSPYEVLNTGALPGNLTFASNYITGRYGPETLNLSGLFGTENITDNTEVSPSSSGLFFYAGYDPAGANILRNAISGTTSTFIGLYSAGAPLAGGGNNTIENNLVYNYPDAVSFAYDAFGDTPNNAVVAGVADTSTVVTANVGEGESAAVRGGVNISNNFLVSTVSGSQGTLFFSSNSTTTITNNILEFFQEPPSASDANVSILDYNGAYGHTYSHNTVIGPSDDADGGCGASGDTAFEMGDGPGLGVSSTIIKSNLTGRVWYGIGVKQGPVSFLPDYDGVGVHHNDVYDYGCAAYIDASDTVDFDNGVVSHPSSIYGDITANPEYFDPTRTSILQYDSRVLAGSGTAADVFAQLGYRSGWGGTNTLGSNPINTMRQWLFAGYAPTNAALIGSAADGGTDGAVAFEDATPPSITLVSPTSGSPVSGTITLTASSTDDVAVQGVQFQVDGANLGSLITATSGATIYSTTWDTTVSGNGSHTITAIAYDTSNNSSTVSVSVTVNNGGALSPASVHIEVAAGYGSGSTMLQPITPTNAASTSPAATSDLLQQLATLQAQFAALMAQKNNSSNSQASNLNANESSTPSRFVFLKNLALGNTDPDVLRLQEYLNAEGFVLVKSGAGSPGNETDFFGNQTKKQLVRFQASVGIPATGWFGPMTRGYINGQ